MKEIIAEINGLKWAVRKVEAAELQDDDGGDTLYLGQTKFVEQQVLIAENLSAEQEERILIHEFTHAYIFSFGMCSDNLNEEKLCDFIANNAINIIQLAKYVHKQWKEEETGDNEGN